MKWSRLTRRNPSSTRKILATGATVSAVLLSLTGGLGLVLRSLRKNDLTLSLSLTRVRDADGERARAVNEARRPTAAHETRQVDAIEARRPTEAQEAWYGDRADEVRGPGARVRRR